MTSPAAHKDLYVQISPPGTVRRLEQYWVVWLYSHSSDDLLGTELGRSERAAKRKARKMLIAAEQQKSKPKRYELVQDGLRDITGLAPPPKVRDIPPVPTRGSK